MAIVITHVVLMKLQDENDLAEAISRLRSMVGKIPTLLSLKCGTDALNAGGGDHVFDLALVSEHPDAQGLAEYQVHPVHLEVMEWLSPRRIGRAVVDSLDFG